MAQGEGSGGCVTRSWDPKGQFATSGRRTYSWVSAYKIYFLGVVMLQLWKSLKCGRETVRLS